MGEKNDFAVLILITSTLRFCMFGTRDSFFESLMIASGLTYSGYGITT